MATLITDAFTRADSTTVPGSPSVGGPYTVRVGTWGIIGNALYTSASLGNSHLTFPAAIDCDITCTMNAVGGSAGILVRWIDASNFWVANLSNTGSLSLQRNVAGTFAVRSVATGGAITQTVRVACSGRYLTLFSGGVQIATVEDENYLAATATAGIRCNSNITNRYDDLSGIDTVALGTLTGTVSDTTDTNRGSAPQSGPGGIWKGGDKKALDTVAAA